MRTLILSRPDRVGDVVITTSCLAPIRDKYPDAKLFFVAAERMRPLLEGHPLVDGFVSLASNLTEEFKRLNASAIVHLHPDKDCYAAAANAGVPMRVGYPERSLNHHLSHKIAERRKEGLQHEAAYNFDLLRVIDVPMPAKLSASIHLSDSSFETMQRKVPWPLASTPFAVLHPAAHSKFARWPAARFVQLAENIHKNLGLFPVIVGTDANDSIESPHLNFAGQTDLGELGWLLKHAQVLITNDSGPAHIAAAVGCPVVSIFGRTAPLYGPVRWRPLSESAIVVSKPLDRKRFETRHAHWKRCFAAVEVADVESAVANLLKIRA